MNKNETEDYQGTERVTKFFDKPENLAACKGVVRIAHVVEQIKENQKKALEYDSIAMGSTKEATQGLQKSRLDLTEHLEDCIDGLVAYASEENVPGLQDVADYNPSALDKARKQQLITISTNILNLSKKHSAAIAQRGVFETDIAGLEAALAVFMEKYSDPQEIQDQMTLAKRDLQEILDLTVRKILPDQLDRMVNSLKKTNPDFVKAYYRARTGIALPTKTTQVAGIIMGLEADQESRGLSAEEAKNPVYKAEVMLDNEDRREVTDLEGNFHFEKVSPGDRTITVFLNGEEVAKIGPFKVAAGETSRHTITLPPVDDTKGFEVG